MNRYSPDQLLHQCLTDHPEFSQDLGERLYEKITTVVIPEGRAVFNSLTREDCIGYIHRLTIERTLDQDIGPGYIRKKSVIYDNLANIFPTVQFAEIYDALRITEADINDDMAYIGDVDYLGYVGEKAFGVQIKPTTAKANFGNYSVSERMKNSFLAFQEDFSGRVFIVFSLDGEIGNPEIIPEIAEEIARLRA